VKSARIAAVKTAAGNLDMRSSPYSRLRAGTFAGRTSGDDLSILLKRTSILKNYFQNGRSGRVCLTGAFRRRGRIGSAQR
jgi:hypothetical protein